MPAPGAPDVASALARLPQPARMVITAGMPYANGPLHLGHLAGAHVPADIYARWCRMRLGQERVLFVCGTDDHGSTTELAAAKAGQPIRAFLDSVHASQRATLARYAISLDIYSGTSRPESFPQHVAQCQAMLRQLHANGLLVKRRSRQWYDVELARFLPDRLVRGTCPNPKCGAPDAYSDECERCGHQHEPEQLIDPRSALSGGVPELRETVHWWLDMWAVAEPLRAWLESKRASWRRSALAEPLDRVQPALHFANSAEQAYRALRDRLPAHRMKYTPGKRVLLQFASRAELAAAGEELRGAGIAWQLADEWAHRSITRDIAWGIPLPELDPELAGKTLYVWPDSLIAPIAFTQAALAAQGRDPGQWRAFWCDPQARVVQFLGQDNVFFYVLMQGALWLGAQPDPQRLPLPGELQLTDIVANCHLLVDGEKMSKSRGNFYTGDQLLERGYDADQVRYFLAMLALAERPADFDFGKFAERNAFLAGPMNAALEKPISACHSKFGGRVPEGRLLPEVAQATQRILVRYVAAMERAEYPALLFEIENYARLVNSLFARYKPHDDRHPEEGRRDALFSSFFIVKHLLLMLHPFVPATMERLRQSLALSADIYRVEQFGQPLPAGHAIAAMQRFFPGREQGAAQPDA
ncbi:MAG: class I tRNA ligase family protein [Planctomycetota bacterium]|nr:class I tRNA ligase family protein [Planctomycetota bacterium]MCX8040408.1 class I tRNA ligase family protein [Planctomycetota bacterium]MDW8372216.1 class I tRNA ligase family protein [Planctomycetota bacterium]